MRVFKPLRCNWRKRGVSIRLKGVVSLLAASIKIHDNNDTKEE